jgi:hypothetical protein
MYRVALGLIVVLSRFGVMPMEIWWTRLEGAGVASTHGAPVDRAYGEQQHRVPLHAE